MALKDKITTQLQPLISESFQIGDAVQREGTLSLSLTIAPEQQHAFQPKLAEMQAALEQMEGVDKARIVLTASRKPTGDAPQKKPAQWNLTPLENVRQVIAVASGKGGVGKSTTTVGLAHALVAEGKRVGILDADIFGPSIPRMLGLKDAGQPSIADGRMIPLEGHGIKAISMGNIAGDQAAVMRGPMLAKALQQMLRTTLWAPADAPLDVLLIDMPPGTGDVQLSLAQYVPLDGAILVTTPQEIALADVRKSAQMFEKVNVKLLGVVENMSGFTDPSGVTHAIFGEGGGQALADTFNCPLLAQIPLNPSLRAAMDMGEKADFAYYKDVITACVSG